MRRHHHGPIYWPLLKPWWLCINFWYIPMCGERTIQVMCPHFAICVLRHPMQMAVCLPKELVDQIHIYSLHRAKSMKRISWMEAVGEAGCDSWRNNGQFVHTSVCPCSRFINNPGVVSLRSLPPSAYSLERIRTSYRTCSGMLLFHNYRVISVFETVIVERWL